MFTTNQGLPEHVTKLHRPLLQCRDKEFGKQYFLYDNGSCSILYGGMDEETYIVERMTEAPHLLADLMELKDSLEARPFFFEHEWTKQGEY